MTHQLDDKVAVISGGSFFGAGYGMQQALEVVLGLAAKTISNFTNSIAETPLDREVKNLAWRKPTVTRGNQATKPAPAQFSVREVSIERYEQPMS